MKIEYEKLNGYEMVTLLRICNAVRRAIMGDGIGELWYEKEPYYAQN